MQIHNLKRETANKKKIQVGRGAKRGKTSGRGTKGQNARAGHKKRPEMRDIIKKIPKLRGRGKNSLHSIQADAVAVNLNLLSVFKAGETVTPKTLAESGVITMYKGRYPRVKILSTGDISTKLNFANCEVSAGAKAKIEQVGGTIKG
ncbi:MAG: hypothetical protein RL094_204 [Candidatus Parcubacteria bacterium]|jgi:large subunit ribosomal protein L15